MNLLLLSPEELDEGGTVTLTSRRAVHARQILRAAAGDALRVGVLGGRAGTARVLESSGDALRLRVELTDPPPARPGFDLLLAIPRPKALKKVLPAIAALGVDRVVLVNAARVEKSYFDSHVLAPEEVRRLLLLGLEQARDTHLPEVRVRPRFRPFVEDELDAVFGTERARLVAHPARSASALGAPGPALLAVGPEGGWVPFELELLAAQGFSEVSLGPRTLRVETAVPYLLGWLEARRAPVLHRVEP